MGKVNNQNFVQIPYCKFRMILQYLCEENGIRFICREESYTSKASFLFQDKIPTYKKPDAEDAVFSGIRGPTRYCGHYRKNGFRGIYQNEDGSTVNSDLNGSANIGRKEFPDLFSPKSVRFTGGIVVAHPDDLLSNPKWDRGRVIRPS